MSVRVLFDCGGCDAKADGTAPLRVHFVGFNGRPWGFGTVQPANTPQDVAPPGWIAFDPYTFATYCPACWESIEGSAVPRETLEEK